MPKLQQARPVTGNAEMRIVSPMAIFYTFLVTGQIVLAISAKFHGELYDL